jgi:agmatinase
VVGGRQFDHHVPGGAAAQHHPVLEIQFLVSESQVASRISGDSSGACVMMPFQMPATFCGVSTDVTKPIQVAGASWDSATTFRSGARLAPHAIRSVSRMLTDGVHDAYDVDIQSWVSDAGDWHVSTGDTQKALAQITQAHDAHMQQGHHVVTLGGDHLITLGVLRSLHAHMGPVAVLHLDAHCDTWSDHFGEPHGHGTWLRNAIEEQLVDATQVMSVGLRSPVDASTRAWLSQQGGHQLSARSAALLHPVQMSTWIQDRIRPHTPVYVSLDIDCLDPAHAPGTGTPEIGGLTTMWLSEVLDLVFQEPITWAGMDVVEVAPAYDHSEITALAAATFVWQYVSMLSFRMQNSIP